MRALLIVMIVLLGPGLLRAEPASYRWRNSPISILEFKQWRASVPHPIHPFDKQDDVDGTRLFECANVKELAGFFACLGPSRLIMGEALSRIQIYSSTHRAKKPVLISNSQPDPDLSLKLFRMATTDYEFDSIAIKDFFAAANKACTDLDRDYCLTDAEKDFYTQIYEPLTAKHDRFVIYVTTSASLDNYVMEDSINSGLLAAEYFLNQTYAEIVDRFWDGLPEGVRTQMRVAIMHYRFINDFNDPVPFRREYHYHVLSESEVFYPWKEYSNQYREQLLKELNQAGIRLILNPKR